MDLKQIDNNSECFASVHLEFTWTPGSSHIGFEYTFTSTEMSLNST